MNEIRRILTARTLYAVLEVPPAAGADVIKAAYRALARRFHPDLCKLTNAHDLCARVNDAYSVLSDSEARLKYDVINNTAYSYCAQCAGRGTAFKQKGFANKILTLCAECDGSGLR